MSANENLSSLSSNASRLTGASPTAAASTAAGSALAAPGLGRHVPALDGLRGCAVLAVIMYHYFELNSADSSHPLDRIANTIAYAGWSGVDLFFVLSGFLITGILYDTRRNADYFRTFYARRVLRIFPLYYGCLFVFLLVIPAIWAGSDASSVDGVTEISLWTYLLNLRISFGGWNVVPTYLVPFWTLAIEEQFYLVWPLLVFTLSRRALLRTCAAILVGGLALRAWLHSIGLPDAAEALTLARMDGLVVGAGLALASREPKELAALLRWSRPALLVAVPVLVGLRAWRGSFTSADPVVGTVGLTILALAFGALLLLAVHNASSGAGRFFSAPPLQFFGRYSYALYVFHQAIGIPLVAMGVTAAALSPFDDFALPGLLAFMVIGTLGSVAAALLSWHLYEKHFLRLKDRFTYGTQDVASGAEDGASLRAVSPS